MATKPMTAAEYAAHAEAVEAKRPTVVKTLKSGSVFELRKPDLQRMTVLGLIPQSLIDEGLSAWEESGVRPRVDKSNLRITADAAKNGLITMREVVRAACVMPPFNEITAKSFLKEDFDEIYYWAMGHEEGPAVDGLRTFRKGRKRRITNRRVDGEKLQPETISTAAN